jgi:hypothetical protein
VTLSRIVKRDGREVPFERARIRDAVARAQAAVGDDDPLFAEEVADVVTMTLERTHAPPPEDRSPGLPSPSAPHVEEIQDLVELALVQMGRAPVAKAYILYRDRRSRLRELVRVERPAGAATPLVSDEDGTAPWSRSHLARTLMGEAGLTRPVAEDVAERVEARVFGLGLGRVSSSLVRELAAGELAVMGLASALRQREPIGLSRHELRNLLAVPSPPATTSSAFPSVKGDADDRPPEPVGRAVDRAIGERVLRRYTLDDILGEQNADLFRAGELALAETGAPHLPLTLGVPCSLLLPQGVRPSSSAGVPTGAGSAWDLLDEAGPLAAATSRGLTLEGVGPYLAPLLRSSSRPDPLRPWLTALSALSRTSGRWLDLSRVGGRSPRVLESLIHTLAEMERERSGFPAPRLFLTALEARVALEESSDRHSLAASMERLLATSRLIPTWGAERGAGRTNLRRIEGEVFAAPGCRRRDGDRSAVACGGAVAVHLPRLARRAGPWREERLFEALAARVEQALDALGRLAEFQRLRQRPEPGQMRPRTCYALVPVGLAEALRILGDGQIRPDQGARLLGLAADAVRRFSAGRGLAVTLSPFFGTAPARRFAELDARTPGWNQGLLFAEAAVDEDAAAAFLPDQPRDPVPYGTGFSLTPGDGFRGPDPLVGQPLSDAEAIATLISAVPSGALLHLPSRKGRPQPPLAGEDPELLSTWLEIDDLRRARLPRSAFPLSGGLARDHNQYAGGSGVPWPLYAEDILSAAPDSQADEPSSPPAAGS